MFKPAPDIDPFETQILALFWPVYERLMAEGVGRTESMAQAIRHTINTLEHQHTGETA